MSIGCSARSSGHCCATEALGGKPKAALNYTVTFAVDVAKPEIVDLVTEKVLKFQMQVGTGS
jgi:hypothetical protein